MLISSKCTYACVKVHTCTTTTSVPSFASRACSGLGSQEAREERVNHGAKRDIQTITCSKLNCMPIILFKLAVSVVLRLKHYMVLNWQRGTLSAEMQIARPSTITELSLNFKNNAVFQGDWLITHKTKKLNWFYFPAVPLSCKCLHKNWALVLLHTCCLLIDLIGFC